MAQKIWPKQGLFRAWKDIRRSISVEKIIQKVFVKNRSPRENPKSSRVHNIIILIETKVAKKFSIRYKVFRNLITVSIIFGRQKLQKLAAHPS